MTGVQVARAGPDDPARDDPPRDCPLCPRLVEFREAWRIREPDWHNAPVPRWGDRSARGLVVGLAPGLRGANRTGRPFTGDYAGDLLFSSLRRHGLATGTYRADPADDFRLADVAIVNAVRCVPPENRPTGIEIATCRRFLDPHLTRPDVRAVLALGRIAHDAVVRSFGHTLRSRPFAHGAEHDFGGVTLLDSYHCSRYNTNTGVLTEAMFDAVVARFAARSRRS